MPKPAFRSDWRAQEAAINRAADAKSTADWSHPADHIDPPATPGGPDHAAMAAELMMRILADTVPPPKMRCGHRVLKSGWHRWCAYVYRITPELYVGLTGKEIAETLGISYQAWKKLLDQVDLALRRRDARGGGNCKK